MEVKGIAVEVFQPFLSERHGPAGYRQWLDSLPDPSRELLSAPVDPNRWYPLREAFVDPTLAMCRMFHGESLDGAKEIGHYSARRALGGVFRSAIKLVSVRLFILRATAMMPTYYRPSQLAVPEIGERRAVICITHFPEPHPAVDNRIAGWARGALEAHGQRSASANITRSLAAGDPYTEIILEWK